MNPEWNGMWIYTVLVYVELIKIKLKFIKLKSDNLIIYIQMKYLFQTFKEKQFLDNIIVEELYTF